MSLELTHLVVGIGGGSPASQHDRNPFIPGYEPVCTVVGTWNRINTDGFWVRSRAVPQHHNVAIRETTHWQQSLEIGLPNGFRTGGQERSSCTPVRTRGTPHSED